MTILLTALLGCAPADDEAARALLEKVKLRITSARTIRADHEVKTPEATIRGFIRIGEGHRFRYSREYDTANEEMRSQGFRLVCDGRRIVARHGEGTMPAAQLPPEKVEQAIRGQIWGAEPDRIFHLHPEDGRARNVLKPIRSDVRDGGTERFAGREARVLRFTLAYRSSDGDVRFEQDLKIFIDPERLVPLGSSAASDHFSWTQTWTRLELDVDLSDAEFEIASREGFARARTEQLARSVELFARFTGRLPRSLEELRARPDDVAFWPRNGFVLRGTLPKDPPARLAREDGRLFVEGGGHRVEVAPALRGAIGAPTERLRRHYTARVELALIAAAVEAYRQTYGSIPRKKADLWTRPEGTNHWPEGGWLAGENVPEDPWGEPYRIVTEAAYVRVQVRDPRARILYAGKLTPEERRALEETARPKITGADRLAMERLLDRLADDDLETRERARAELDRWGLHLLPPLRRRLESTTDRYARKWLRRAREAIPDRPPGWRAELRPLLAVAGRPSDPGGIEANERYAAASLKTLATAEYDFRSNDRDGNRKQDFWTGDVAGLYLMTSAHVAGTADDPPIRLIELRIAAADLAPLEGDSRPAEYAPLEGHASRAPSRGYHYRAMVKDRSQDPPVDYAQDTDGTGALRNFARFGFCAVPSEYGLTGLRTFIINETATVWWKDTGGQPVLEWPSDRELRAEWKKLD